MLDAVLDELHFRILLIDVNVAKELISVSSVVRIRVDLHQGVPKFPLELIFVLLHRIFQLLSLVSALKQAQIVHLLVVLLEHGLIPKHVIL